MAFAEENAKQVFNIITSLKNNDKKHVPNTIYKKYKKLVPSFKEMFKNGDYTYQAIRSALKEYQNSLIFKNKLLKTIGGFTALLLFVNPINNFVDKQIMKRFINPGIDQISKGFINESNMKVIFNNMNNKSTNPSKENASSSNLLEKLKSQRG